MRTPTAAPAASPAVNMQAFRPLAEACYDAVQALDKATHNAAKHQREAKAATEEVQSHLAVINALREQIRLRFPGAPGVVGRRAWSHLKDYVNHGNKYQPVDGDIVLDEPSKASEIISAIQSLLETGYPAITLSNAINDVLVRAGGDPLSEPHEVALTVADAVDALKLAMRNDLDFAWTWHCNIAVPIMDSSSLGQRLANKSAAHLMRHLFDVDMTQYGHYVELMAKLQEDDLKMAGTTPQPTFFGIDLGAEAMAELREESQQTGKILARMPGAAVEVFEHRLFTEKASEVRTLLSGLYDRCVVRNMDTTSLTFGQLCDVMNLLDPTPSPRPAPVDDAEAKGVAIMKEAASTIEGMFEATAAAAAIEPRPDMLDASQEPAEQPISIDMDKVVSAAVGVRYTFDQFIEHGRAYCGVHGIAEVNGMPWSFTFHGHPVSHERDDMYLISDGAFVTYHFHKADEISLLPDGTFRIHSAALETLGQPSGYRRVFVAGDIVRGKNSNGPRLCEVVGVEDQGADLQVRFIDGSSHPFRICASLVELAPMAEAAKAVGQMNAVKEVDDKAVGNGRNGEYEGLFKSETLKQRGMRLTAFGWPSSRIKATALDLGLKDEVGHISGNTVAEPMKPTIGRRVWFHPHQPSPDISVLSTEQPLDAGVVYVWSDRLVNLDVTDHQGQHHAFTSVRLLQPGEDEPNGCSYACWMPFQIKQAGKA